MRRFVNMAKSGRMAATRRVPPPAAKPLREDAAKPRSRRGATSSTVAAKRRG